MKNLIDKILVGEKSRGRQRKPLVNLFDDSGDAGEAGRNAVRSLDLGSSPSTPAASSPQGKPKADMPSDDVRTAGNTSRDSEPSDGGHVIPATGSASESDKTRRLQAGLKIRHIALQRIEVEGSATLRQTFDQDAIDELADSIRQNGLLQPVLLRHHPEGPDEIGPRYRLVAGERRRRAARAAGLKRIPAIVLRLSEAQALQIGLIENVQREKLPPLEEAATYQTLIQDHGHTYEEVAKAVSKSRSYISNMMRLLKLPDAVKASLAEGELSVGHARSLLGAENPEALAREIAEYHLSVRETEQRIREERAAAKDVASTRIYDNRAVFTYWQDRLSGSFECKAKITSGRAEKPVLKLSFGSLEEMEHFLSARLDWPIMGQHTPVQADNVTQLRPKTRRLKK